MVKKRATVGESCESEGPHKDTPGSGGSFIPDVLRRMHDLPPESATCGARTRDGGRCVAPVAPGKRCRHHGGASTGPRTPEGRARCSEAGRRGAKARWRPGWRQRARERERKQFVRALEALGLPVPEG